MFPSSPEERQSPVPFAFSLPTKYGELVMLGPDGDRGRRNRRFPLYRRTKANSVRPSSVSVFDTPQAFEAASRGRQRRPHSASYVMSSTQTVVVEYSHDEGTDMFQIGRYQTSPVDFVVTDPENLLVSRFACRVVCQRAPPHTARVYAAGFDSTKNIFLGEKAVKWTQPDGTVDGLTTNGILVMHPGPTGGGSGSGSGSAEESQSPVWREVSVCGDLYALRDPRSRPGYQQPGAVDPIDQFPPLTRGQPLPDESNVLRDGSLLYLFGGVTLLWRTAAGLRRTATREHLECLRREVNAARPQCPVGLRSLYFPPSSGGAGSRPNTQDFAYNPVFGRVEPANTHTLFHPSIFHHRALAEDKQPWVYLACGHVHGYHDWGRRGPRGTQRQCPLCRTVGRYVALRMGREPAFYVDDGTGTGEGEGEGAPMYAFVPCGHVCTEKTAKYWSGVLMPHATPTGFRFHAACPFCAKCLDGARPCTKLIFN